MSGGKGEEPMAERSAQKPVPGLDRLPKLELHLHFEGCIGPELVLRLAERHGNKLPPEEVRRLYSFNDFPGFLKAFARVVELLAEPDDFRLVAAYIAERLKAQGVIYAELIFTPLIHIRRGLDHEAVIEAMLAGLSEVEGAPRVNFIYDTVRQWGADAARLTLETLLDDRECGRPVVGYGVGGDELSTPADQLREPFRRARDNGFGIFVHAGEVGRADSVREAVELLGADRIGHGIAAAEDPFLLEILRERGVCLDVCPTSNLFTGGVPDLASHPLPRLLAAGVPVTVGSDDPGFFGTWLEDELRLCAGAWRWELETIRALMRTAARHAFLPEAERTALEASLTTTE